MSLRRRLITILAFTIPSTGLSRLGSHSDSASNDFALEYFEAAPSETSLLARKERRLATEKFDPYDQARIVGGDDASAGEYEFFVDWSGCGASLIHEDIALSAAHCTVLTSNTVYVGAYKSQSTSNGAERRNIVNRRVHHRYRKGEVDYDIVVLKLDDSTSFKPAELSGSTPGPGTSLIAMGHGKTESGGQSSTLQEVVVPRISDDDCEDYYDNFKHKFRNDIMLCAGEAGKDTCTGDSGGPLVQKAGSKYNQVGITSWGNGCANEEYPGVYTKVSSFRGWIRQQICELSDNRPSYCPSISSSKTPVRVEITYDKTPKETGWSIRKGSNTIVNYEEGSLQFQSGLTVERVYLDPGEYTFTMTDSYGDGICCNHGRGKYEIYAELGNRDVLLAQGDGKFDDITTSELDVPED